MSLGDTRDPQWISIPVPRTRGVLLHVAGIVFSGALVAVLLTSVGLVGPGLSLILVLLGSLLFGAVLAVLVYHLYALMQSGYWLGRAGLRLRWGLRQVAIPFSAILDVAAMDELETPIQLPRWSWPGSVIGTSQDSELGKVEFMAARKEGLVVVGTADQVFVISPEDAAQFLGLYHSQVERGAIQAMRSQSVAPSFVLAQAWAQPDLRRLLLIGAGLVVALLALVGVLAPRLGSVPLGFGPDGLALEPVPASQIFLLPALNLLFYLGNLLVGLMLYREGEAAHFTRLMWGASLFTSFLFLIAIWILILV